MALTTQSMAGEIKREVAGAPEGYEFVHDEDGRMALKKIRKVEEKKVEKVVEKVVKKATKKKFNRK